MAILTLTSDGERVSIDTAYVANVLWCTKMAAEALSTWKCHENDVIAVGLYLCGIACNTVLLHTCTEGSILSPS